MSGRIAVLALDVTGKLPANKIQGELHSPAPGKLRLLIPRWGAFFAEGMELFDASTNAPLAPEDYAFGDSWPLAQEASGKAVHTSLLLKESAPVDVKWTYQAYGGPQSRNAQELLDWLQEHMSTNNATTAFSDLEDVPKTFTPSEHKHLLAHVFGMEFITSQLDRLRENIDIDHDSKLQDDYELAKLRIARMQISSDRTVEAGVADFWAKWKATITLYTLGVDLLKNYPVLGAGGVYAAAPSFALDNPDDERYVDLAGLGAFSKELVSRCVTADSGLGLDLAQVREAQRGSFIGATVGEVFFLPAPMDARKLNYVNMAVYPKGWPDTHPMVVVKHMANFGDRGGVFQAYDTFNGTQYMGVLAADSWKTPLVWSKVYHSDETTAIAEALKAHVEARSTVHEETKEQLGLGHWENLPVVDEDTIVTGETGRYLVTYDALMAFVRVRQEQIKLKRDSAGKVDYTDTMDKTRVIINGANCGPAIAPKDQFISSFCDGTHKYARMTDGLGSFYDKLVEEDSFDCGFADRPQVGTKLSEFCDGTTLKARYADGKGGYTIEISQAFSTNCGYVKPSAYGTVISTLCRGVDQVTRYADGLGGFYDSVTSVNTYQCGGTIYPNSTAAPGTTGTPAPTTSPGGNAATLVLSSSHNKLYKNTTEIIGFKATGLVAQAVYPFDLIASSPSFNQGKPFILYSGTVTAIAGGTARWEQTRVDDGVATTRGEYKTWVSIESANLKSNEISRSFLAGTSDGKPDNPISADDGKDINGNDYGAGPIWPPVVRFDPRASFGSDRSTIFVGDNETLTVELSGFYAGKDYVAEFWLVHPGINNGAPFKSLEVQMTTDAGGGAIYKLAQYDNGVTPRGVAECWIEVQASSGLVRSNQLVRTFAEGSSVNQPYRTLACTVSHSTIYIGTAYTHTVVLAGASPNTRYTIELRRSFYSATIEEGTALIHSAVVTTDSVGTARMEISAVYDGTAPPPRAYDFYARLTGLDQMSSNSSATFVNRNGAQSDRARVTIASTNSTIRKGTTETISSSLTNHSPNQTIDVEYWYSSPSANGGQDTRASVGSVRIGSDGNGSHSFQVTDDGQTAPRGDYQTWAVVPVSGAVSAKITRSFLADGVSPTSAPNAITTTFSSNQSNISAGTVETLTVVAVGAKANTVYDLFLYISSPALNNGGQPLRTLTTTATSNSQGRIEWSVQATDDGLTVPRGTYSSWAEVGGARSPAVVRNFTGTPPPTQSYNPALSFSKTTQISRGTLDENYGKLTGARPNTSYTLDAWIQGPNLASGQPYRAASVAIVTDARGEYVWSSNSVDNGEAVPRGSYSCWLEIRSIGLRSNTVIANYVGTPAPTPPPYNPSIAYWTDRSSISAGTYESHAVSIAGMMPNRAYAITLYFSSSAVNGGQNTPSATLNITTDSNGSGQGGLTAYDDGQTVPRGAYATWAVINETGTQSSVFTRYFV